jgi:hypothetical protein
LQEQAIGQELLTLVSSAGQVPAIPPSKRCDGRRQTLSLRVALGGKRLQQSSVNRSVYVNKQGAVNRASPVLVQLQTLTNPLEGVESTRAPVMTVAPDERLTQQKLLRSDPLRRGVRIDQLRLDDLSGDQAAVRGRGRRWIRTDRAM